VSRASILRFLDHAPQAIRLFDVNLRQSFFDANTLLQGARRATVMKLNEAELHIVGPLLGEAATHDPIDACRRLRERLNLHALALTRGERGTSLVTAQGVIQGRGDRSWPHQAGADAVGAGDACSAGLLVGLLRGWTEIAVALADAMGGYVASCRGATPTLPAALVERASP
jgi:fructokinase